MTYERIYPGKYFETINGVEAEQNIYVPVNASTSNVQLTAVNAGKSWRLLSLVAFSSAAAIEILFRSASSGTVIGSLLIPAATAGSLVLPYNSSGWLNGPSGTGIWLDVGAGGNLKLTSTWVNFNT
jgi:hypothetical protein